MFTVKLLELSLFLTFPFDTGILPEFLPLLYFLQASNSLCQSSPSVSQQSTNHGKHTSGAVHKWRNLFQVGRGQKRKTIIGLWDCAARYRVNHQCCSGGNCLETPPETPPRDVSGYFWPNHWQIQTKFSKKENEKIF